MSKYKKQKAAALRYHAEEDAAPVVIASGYGTAAEKIIDIAEHKGIPVFKDDSAASMLCMMEVGSNIPTELYEVVAAIYCKLMETSDQIKNAEKADKAVRETHRGRQGKSAVRSSLRRGQSQKGTQEEK